MVSDLFLFWSKLSQVINFSPTSLGAYKSYEVSDDVIYVATTFNTQVEKMFKEWPLQMFWGRESVSIDNLARRIFPPTTKVMAVVHSHDT